MYSFIAIEVILLPLILPEDVYVQVEYGKFVLFFMPFLLIGAPSGYAYYKIKKK